MKKIKIIASLIVVLFGLKVAAQEETYIKYDKKYISSLGEENDIDETLHFDTYKERFNFLNYK